MEELQIKSAGERTVQKVPVDAINVVNPRNRDRRKFNDNVRSIRDVGLLKPIVVNRHRLAKTGRYDLVCGQGRVMAYQKLGIAEIDAQVIDCPEDQAHLMTLGENITRTPPEAIDFAMRLKEMHDKGITFEQLSAITGRCEPYIRDYIKLVENGEERLIKGVEDEIFPLTFALSVAQSDDRSVQHLLMDAFDNGIVNSNNLGRVRRIIDDRMEKGKALGERKKEDGKYTVANLKRDIQKITREKETFVRQAGQKENRLFRLLVAFRQLHEDKEFCKLLDTEGLSEQPELKGKYEF